MATRWLQKIASQTMTGQLLDRVDGTYAGASGCGVDIGDGYKFKYNQNGTIVQLADTVNGYQIAGPLVSAPTGTALASIVAGGATTITSPAPKNKASILDNTATTIWTVTIPNAQNNAAIELYALSVLGAGGAIGAGEAASSSYYTLTVSRTAGVATVVGVSSQTSESHASVAGAATITATVAASGITGANSVSQTFNIQVTIARGSGSSTNHTCFSAVTLFNQNGSGITIA